MVFDKFVEGIEFHHPQEEFALRVTQHFEMLNAVRTSGKGENEVNEILRHCVKVSHIKARNGLICHQQRQI